MSEDKERVDWEVQHQLEVRDGMAGSLSLLPPLREEEDEEEEEVEPACARVINSKLLSHPPPRGRMHLVPVTDHSAVTLAPLQFGTTGTSVTLDPTKVTKHY